MNNSTGNQVHTVEPQYNVCLELDSQVGRTRLGLMANYSWMSDPKRLSFLFSRYKFVAKMLSDKKHALEIGCADGFASRIVRQAVPLVTATDFDSVFIEDAKAQVSSQWPIEFKWHDILKGPVQGKFDCAYSLDVFEHIPPAQEDVYIRNIIGSIEKHGTVIIGTPSLESQAYASTVSKEGHVNCKSGLDLKALFAKHFHYTFLFSMNDEVIHTGYHRMSQYLFILACEPRSPSI
jgi:2-polyprenyl-3-methyl-5-hydroxy-6-metoxy-1,4-benzoquinol methylase